MGLLGQEIDHSTLRLFLGSETVQLIVTDYYTERAANYKNIVADRITGEPVRHLPVGYWVNAVQELSPGSPILLMHNKIDEGLSIHRAVKKLLPIRPLNNWRK